MLLLGEKRGVIVRYAYHLLNAYHQSVAKLNGINLQTAFTQNVFFNKGIYQVELWKNHDSPIPQA